MLEVKLVCNIIFNVSEKNTKFLSSLMIKTGAMLAQQIDSAASKKVKGYQKDHLNRIITTGRSHIGRLLHYFPFA